MSPLETTKQQIGESAKPSNTSVVCCEAADGANQTFTHLLTHRFIDSMIHLCFAESAIRRFADSPILNLIFPMLLLSIYHVKRRPHSFLTFCTVQGTLKTHKLFVTHFTHYRFWNRCKIQDARWTSGINRVVLYYLVSCILNL